ncbi:DUF4384 domain-containing protein [Candidatus Poribacteria bacterium]|nr:DUF4384 domain-containing protein [Candidatus Poribacteria bacterium]
MKDEEFEKIMDVWASYEIKSAPQLHPTEKMYQMVEAKKRKVIFPIYVRWALAGIAAASIILLAILHPAIFRPAGMEEPSVGQRRGLVSEKGVTTKGPLTPGGRGPKKGPVFFNQLIFHYQKQDSRTAQAINIQTPKPERITLTSDDNYSLLLQPARDLYIYIYQLDSYGRLMKIFPNDVYSFTQNPLRQGETYRFPSEPNWFYLVKNKGEERIYIVASAQPNQEWEDLHDKYNKADNKQKKQEIFSRLLKEIDVIVEEQSEIAAGWVFVFNQR